MFQNSEYMLRGSEQPPTNEFYGMFCETPPLKVGEAFGGAVLGQVLRCRKILLIKETATHTSYTTS